MATVNAIRAGRAFVELFADDSKLVRGLRRAERRVRAFGRRIQAMGRRMATIMAAITLPVGIFSVRAARDAQETLSRFSQVFRDQAAAARQFADDLAEAVGRSRYEIVDALSTFQSFFVGLGLGGAEARDLSQRIEALALDFASFNNLADAEAVRRFISALSGSGEVLDRFGINIKQAALQQELLRMGVRATWSAVTEQQKALARLNIIMRAMTDQGAVGDAVRTAASFANRLKALRGRLHDTAVAIGNALLPVLTPLVDRFAELARMVSAWAQAHQEAVALLGRTSVGVLAGTAALIVFGEAIENLGAILGLLRGGLHMVGLSLKAAFAIIGFLVTPIGAVIAALAALGGYLVYASGAAGRALAWLGDRFGVLRDDATQAYEGIADALAAGDIGLAARILWLTLKLEWTRGISFLKEKWADFKSWFLNVWNDIKEGALSAWDIIQHNLTVGFIEVKSQLKKWWAELKGLFDWDIPQWKIEGEKRAAEAERGRARRAETERHERRLTEIVDAASRERAEIAADRRRRMAETEADLARARKEWQDAIQSARRKREAKDAAGGPDRLRPPDELQAAIDGLGDALAKATTRGTFYAFAVEGLNVANDAARRTATATERTARNTDVLVRRGGPAFA